MTKSKYRELARTVTPSVEAEVVVLRVKELIAHIKRMRKPAARILMKKMAGVYAAANFGREDLDWLGYANLYDADLCKSLMEYIGYEVGIEARTHDQMEREYSR